VILFVTCTYCQTTKLPSTDDMNEFNYFYFKTDLTPKQTLFSKGAAIIWVPGRVKPETYDTNFGIKKA